MTQTISRIQISETQLINKTIELCFLIALSLLTKRYLKEAKRLKELCYIS